MSLVIELHLVGRSLSMVDPMPVYRAASLYSSESLPSASVVSAAVVVHPHQPASQIGVRIICGVNLWLVSGNLVSAGVIEGPTGPSGAVTQTLALIVRAQYNAGDVIDMVSRPGVAFAWIAR